MVALQDETLSDGMPPLSFKKTLYLALLRLMDYQMTVKSACLGLWSST